MARNILSLDSNGAMDFFLKSEQYCTFELPEYFIFDDLLQSVKETVGDTSYEEVLEEGSVPDQFSGVNVDMLLNKDGHYAVRPITLANPFLYYFLVREICGGQVWNSVKALFEKFNVPHLTSCAIPVISDDKEAFHKSTTIFNWWNSMEQRSIELSLEYRYMFVSDITNCYGSINPQVFEWAFNLKGTQHETLCDVRTAENVQKMLRGLQQGRNIGIPQGSAIFDLLAEIILGYSDLLFYEALQRANINSGYEIIRYRDDYRIFCNDKDTLEKISYILQHVLEGLNFRMNGQKTCISESIVTDSIKQDKLFYIHNTPIFNKNGVDFDSYEKHLLYILMFARKYPNSGSVRTMLSDIDKRVKEWRDDSEVEKISFEEISLDTYDVPSLQNEENVFSKLKSYNSAVNYIPGGSIRAMAAICTQIALENVGCSHYALRVLSRMVDFLDDEEEKWDIIDKVYRKLCSQPNSVYNQLWLQNITYVRDVERGVSPYTLSLCRLVAGENVEYLWNNRWLKAKFTDDICIDSIVDREVLGLVGPVITFRETRGYTGVDYGSDIDEL